jgi:hypothetical protein
MIERYIRCHAKATDHYNYKYLLGVSQRVNEHISSGTSLKFYHPGAVEGLLYNPEKEIVYTYQ